MDAMRELINEQTWNKVKDNVLAFSGLLFGIVVAVLLIAIGKNIIIIIIDFVSPIFFYLNLEP